MNKHLRKPKRRYRNVRNCWILKRDEGERKGEKLLPVFFYCRLPQKGADKRCSVWLDCCHKGPGTRQSKSEHDLSVCLNLSDFQGLKWEALGANPVKILKELSCHTMVLLGCCSEMLDCCWVFLIPASSQMQAFCAACLGSSALAPRKAEWGSVTHWV